MLKDNPFILLLIVAAVLILFGFVIFLAKRYKRCPSQPDPRDLRQGRRRASRRKCIHGGGAFVWPLIQDYDYLDLEPMQIEIPLQGRALDREHPRQRAERVHRRDRHRRRR